MILKEVFMLRKVLLPVVICFINISLSYADSFSDAVSGVHYAQFDDNGADIYLDYGVSYADIPMIISSGYAHNDVTSGSYDDYTFVFNIYPFHHDFTSELRISSNIGMFYTVYSDNVAAINDGRTDNPIGLTLGPELSYEPSITNLKFALGFSTVLVGNGSDGDSNSGDHIAYAKVLYKFK